MTSSFKNWEYGWKKLLWKGFLPVLCSLIFVECWCQRMKDPTVRIAINAWPGYEFLYLAHVKGFFKEVGVDAQIIEFASLSDLRRAFEKGQVDIMAGTAAEVLLSRQNSNRRTQAFIVADYTPDESGVAVIAADEQFIKANPDVIRSVRDSFFRARDYANAHKIESFSIMAKREKMTLEEFLEFMNSGIVLVGRDDQKRFLQKGGRLEKMIERTAKTMIESNQLTGHVDKTDVGWIEE
jgi:ABC-type nitrate/sulfonate/bicarbonate transport system substrate-binding protein